MKRMFDSGKLNHLRSLVLACSPILLLAASPATFAQGAAQPRPAALPVIPAQPVTHPMLHEEGTETAAKTPGSEGIKVHGHWKIVIKNPDGSVASNTEFENSLITPGAGDAVLSQFLTGTSVPGTFAIQISSKLCGTASTPAGCVIFPSGSGSTEICPASSVNVTCFPTMTTTYVAATASSSAAIQLAGSFTATSSGALNEVFTYSYLCSSNAAPPRTASPAQCYNYFLQGGTPPGDVSGTFAYPFTGTTTSAAVTAPGQVVIVTVTLSFS